MFKFLLIALILGISFSLLCADEYYEKFTNYSQERNIENFQAAQIFYTSLLEEDEEDFQSALLMAYLHFMELNNFIMYLNENIEDLPNRTKFQYANLLLSLNQYEKSLEIYNMVTEALPNWSCGWRHQGEAYFLNKDYENAERSLHKAIETRIEHWDAYIWLAKVQLEMGKYKEALDTFNLGQTYYGKDIEDPDEEFSPEEVIFLHLRLLMANNKTNEFNQLMRVARERFPDSDMWSDLNL